MTTIRLIDPAEATGKTRNALNVLTDGMQIESDIRRRWAGDLRRDVRWFLRIRMVTMYSGYDYGSKPGVS